MFQVVNSLKFWYNIKILLFSFFFSPIKNDNRFGSFEFVWVGLFIHLLFVVNDIPCVKMHNKSCLFFVCLFLFCFYCVIFHRMCVSWLSCPPVIHFFAPGGSIGLPRSFPRNFTPITLSILPKIKLFGIPRPAS